MMLNYYQVILFAFLIIINFNSLFYYEGNVKHIIRHSVSMMYRER